jgi:DNA polymerase elongation subunit (family B)
MKKATVEEIEKYLEGYDEQKYIVGIESSYHENKVSLIIHDPEKGKRIEKHKFRPFMWMKTPDLPNLYGGDRREIKKKMREYSVSFKELITTVEGEEEIPRLVNGYKYIAHTKKSYTNLINFFKDGGMDPFSEQFRGNFQTINPTEQFLIQSGKRLFKGMEDYEDVHRLSYDIETTGLDPNLSRIFQIGAKDNRGFEHVLNVVGSEGLEDADLFKEAKEEFFAELAYMGVSKGVVSTMEDQLNSIVKTFSDASEVLYKFKHEITLTEKQKKHDRIINDLRKKEAQAIVTFFKIITHLKPSIVAGYNSENFDWDFIVVRANLLGLDIKKIAKTLGPIPFYRKRQTLKMGPEMEYYDQTHMWGYNIMDVSHAVRRAQAINSSIKGWGLKYITKYAKAAKPNRVYVQGDKIGETWLDSKNEYWFNNENGEWGILNGSLPEGCEVVTGAYIVERYLIDDLWETEKVDNIFNQATFLLAKVLPTSYMRSATMGTAATWKLLMLGWSYHNNIGIPKTEPLRPFTGGLSRLLEVGWAQGVIKFDFDGLYPSEQLTHGIFTKADISGAMEGLLTYNYNNRNLYKKLKKDYAKQGDMDKSDYYDKKQLPLKILNNGMFGSISAPNVFPWGDTDMGEMITCTGRQYLRHMIRFFDDKGFRPLVGDTDGFNFSNPPNVDEYRYVSNGRHHSTEEGKEYIGAEAVVAEYNDKYMYGVMGLSIDEICTATINLARKNYADLIDGEVKLVGNTIKSKKLPGYISDFIDVGIRMLLDGDGVGFVNEYYDTIERLYNQEIPLSKIANKSRVRMSRKDYEKRRTQLNKAGNPLPKQAHMELMITNDLDLDLGTTIYYVNVGTKKGDGDVQTKKKWNKTKMKKYMAENGLDTFPFDPEEKELIINCELVPSGIIENEPEKTGKYNVTRSIDAFNKRITPLLVCFHPDVRETILITSPEDRQYFTSSQLELTSGMPYKESDQDKLEELLTITDQEMDFWKSIGKSPIFMFEQFDIVDEYCFDSKTKELYHEHS